MTAESRAAIVLACALGLAGCDDGPAFRPLPSSPSPTLSSPPTPVDGYAISVSPESVTSGGDLRVTWTAPKGGTWDWIGIFVVGARNCDHGWYEYTDGALSGTVTFKAPAQPGQYEFRYHLDDGCTEMVRSSPVTVSAGG